MATSGTGQTGGDSTETRLYLLSDSKQRHRKCTTVSLGGNLNSSRFLVGHFLLIPRRPSILDISIFARVSHSRPAWATSGHSSTMLTGYLSFLCCALPLRGIQSTFNWDVSRKFWFGFLFVAVICAKLLHIYAHYDSVPSLQLLLWGSTFFGQDVLFLFVAHRISRNFERRWARILAALVLVTAR